MTTKTSKPQPNLPEEESMTEDIEGCALKIVKHLERNIVLNRDHSRFANRLAYMNKYIQVTYLSGKK